jgi:hypothetical protein
MLQRVQTVQTNFAVKDLIRSLSIAWFNLYGVPPKKSQLAVLYGQWALETGVGTFCWNFNLGNFKAVDIPGQIVEYAALVGTWEIINGQKVVLSVNDPGSWFRSFRSLDSGVQAYVSFLRNQRYKIAWGAVEAGDPAQFVHLLKQQGYFTASEADYLRAVQYHYNVFMNGPSFDAVQQELAGFYNGVAFPPDYNALDFAPVADSQTKMKMRINARSFTSRVYDKLQKMLGK